MRPPPHRDGYPDPAGFGDAGLDAVATVGSPFFNSRLNQLATLAAQYSVRSLFELRQFAEDGGLISYRPKIEQVYRQLGIYVGRIIKGEKVGDPPVWQPDKFDLAINLKTTMVLGVEIPPTLLATADEVVLMRRCLKP